MKKLFNKVSQELVRRHDQFGHAEISLVDATPVRPGEWIKSVGDKVFSVSAKHLNERKDVRKVLWDLDELRERGDADVVWSWFDGETSHIGLGKRVMEPQSIGAGFLVTEGALA